MRRVVVHSLVPLAELAALPIEEADDPLPRQGEVTVEVEAANVSFVDALRCSGQYQVPPTFPYTPGNEVAGRIRAVGDGVDPARVGTRVVAATGSGGFATHALVPAGGAVELPANLDAATAASMLQGYTTMHFSYTRRTELRPDDQVVVLGAGGAVGLAAIDLAKAAGARVVACASSDAKLALAVQAGADATIAYGTDDGFDLKTAIRDATGGAADMVVDPIGGPLSEQALRALGFDGRYLVVGFAAGSIPRVPLNLALLNNRTIAGVELGGWALREAGRYPTIIAEVLELVAAGAIHPLAPTSAPLEDAGRLLHGLITRQLAGRFVVIP
jgi:NADPH2:quinone reductase